MPEQDVHRHSVVHRDAAVSMSRFRNAAAVAVAAAVVAVPGIAQAQWAAGASGPATIGSELMQNATGFKAVCTANTSSSTITLSWTATADPAVNVYHVTRAGTNGGNSGQFDVPGGRTASGFVDNTANTNRNSAYAYTIQAGNQNTFAASNWTTSA